MYPDDTQRSGRSKRLSDELCEGCIEDAVLFSWDDADCTFRAIDVVLFGLFAVFSQELT
jgi:hypothetical protein